MQVSFTVYLIKILDYFNLLFSMSIWHMHGAWYCLYYNYFAEGVNYKSGWIMIIHMINFIL